VIANSNGMFWRENRGYAGGGRGRGSKTGVGGLLEVAGDGQDTHGPQADTWGKVIVNGGSSA